MPIYVDIPDRENIGAEDDSWRNVGTFSTKTQALEWIREHIGPCDDDGKICLLSGEECEETGETGLPLEPALSDRSLDSLTPSHGLSVGDSIFGVLPVLNGSGYRVEEARVLAVREDQRLVVTWQDETGTRIAFPELNVLYRTETAAARRTLSMWTLLQLARDGPAPARLSPPISITDLFPSSPLSPEDLSRLPSPLPDGPFVLPDGVLPPQPRDPQRWIDLENQ